MAGHHAKDHNRIELPQRFEGVSNVKLAGGEWEKVSTIDLERGTKPESILVTVHAELGPAPGPYGSMAGALEFTAGDGQRIRIRDAYPQRSERPGLHPLVARAPARLSGGADRDGDKARVALAGPQGCAATSTEQPTAYQVSDLFGERTLVVPLTEQTWSGDPTSIVLDIEARTRTRLRDGQNPCWFLRLHAHFEERSNPADGVSFAEYVSRRHSDKVEAAPGQRAFTATASVIARAGLGSLRNEGRWDVFICHASEDKETVVEPLARQLQTMGLKVWYDQWELTIGDSLRRKIDEGLAGSDFGVVVLSTAFFSKKWPQDELDGLVQREAGGQKVILPVWHELGIEEVRSYSLLLSGRMGGRTADGIECLVKELLRGMGRAPIAVTRPCLTIA